MALNLNQPLLRGATPEQAAAAQHLAEQTKAAIAKYKDPAAAIADGYEAGVFGGAVFAPFAILIGGMAVGIGLLARRNRR